MARQTFSKSFASHFFSIPHTAEKKNAAAQQQQWMCALDEMLDIVQKKEKQMHHKYVSSIQLDLILSQKAFLTI